MKLYLKSGEFGDMDWNHVA